MKVSKYCQTYLSREEIGKVNNKKYTKGKIKKAEKDFSKNRCQIHNVGETKTTVKYTENSSDDVWNHKSRYSSRPNDYCVYRCEVCNFSGTNISFFFFNWYKFYPIYTKHNKE